MSDSDSSEFLGISHPNSIYFCLIAEIRRRLNDLGAKFVFTDPDRASRVLQATAEAESVQEIFVVDHFDGCTPFDQLIQEPAQGNPFSFDSINRLGLIEKFKHGIN